MFDENGDKYDECDISDGITDGFDDGNNDVNNDGSSSSKLVFSFDGNEVDDGCGTLSLKLESLYRSTFVGVIIDSCLAHFWSNTSLS